MKERKEFEKIMPPLQTIKDATTFIKLCESNTSSVSIWSLPPDSSIPVIMLAIQNIEYEYSMLDKSPSSIFITPGINCKTISDNQYEGILHYFNNIQLNKAIKLTNGRDKPGLTLSLGHFPHFQTNDQEIALIDVSPIVSRENTLYVLYPELMCHSCQVVTISLISSLLDNGKARVKVLGCRTNRNLPAWKNYDNRWEVNGRTAITPSVTDALHFLFPEQSSVLKEKEKKEK